MREEGGWDCGVKVNMLSDLLRDDYAAKRWLSFRLEWDG